MTSEKMKKKQLKRPDQFQRVLLGYVDKAVKHKEKLLLLAAIITVTILGGFAWQSYKEGKGIDRRIALSKIDEAFEEESKKISTRQEELQNKIDELTKNVTNLKVTGGESIMTASAETENLQKQIDELNSQYKELKPDHTKSVKQYQTFFTDHQNTPEGLRAGMNALAVLSEEKKFPEAIELVKSILDHSNGLEFYQDHVRVIYASMLEETGKFKEALNEVNIIAEKASSDRLPAILLLKGRLELLTEQKDVAFATLDKIVFEHADSPEAQKARALKTLW